MELVGTLFQSKMAEGQSLKLTAQFQPYNQKSSKENLIGKKMSSCKTETWVFCKSVDEMQVFSGIIQKKNFLEKNRWEMQTAIIYHNEKSIMVEVVLKTQGL